MSGILFSYASIRFGEFDSIIFGELYFDESNEPCETRVIKFSRKIKHSTVP